jgi:hypothetical protein
MRDKNDDMLANCAAEHHSRGHRRSPSISLNPNVHYRVHKISPILSTPLNAITKRSVSMLSSIYIFVFVVASFLLAFLPITYARSSSPPFALQSPLTSSDSI